MLLLHIIIILMSFLRGSRSKCNFCRSEPAIGVEVDLCFNSCGKGELNLDFNDENNVR